MNDKPAFVLELWLAKQLLSDTEERAVLLNRMSSQ